jgi:hypothetical protein
MDAIVRLLMVSAIRALSPVLMPVDYAFRRLVRDLRGNGWICIEGKIHSVKSDFREPFWVAEFSYNYTIHGEYYSGYDQREFAREHTLDEYAGFFRSGTPITVRVKPTNYQVSFIEDLYSRESAYERMRMK